MSALGPGARKLLLTAHIASSVGWLGAAFAYVALDLAAALSRDAQTVRAANLAMATITSAVIVPVAVASLLIGIVQGLATPLGLFRHYWVVVKLALTTLAAGLLLLYAPTIVRTAELAAGGIDPRDLPGSLLHSIGAVVVLLVITVLSVFKPGGLTRHGWRLRHGEGRARHVPDAEHRFAAEDAGAHEEVDERPNAAGVSVAHCPHDVLEGRRTVAPRRRMSPERSRRRRATMRTPMKRTAAPRRVRRVDHGTVA